MRLFSLIVAIALFANAGHSEVLRRTCGSTKYELMYDTAKRVAVFVTRDHLDVVSAEKVERRDNNAVMVGTTDKGVHIMAIFVPDGTGTVGIWDAHGAYVGKDDCKRD